MTTRADRLRDAIGLLCGYHVSPTTGQMRKAGLKRRKEIMESCLAILFEAEVEVELLRKREPTQEEGDAHEGGPPNYVQGECFVDGGWTGRRCRVCRRWAWGGPTRCAACVAKKERDDARARAVVLDGRANELLGEMAMLQAKLSRYEAPGPALLYVGCGDHDVACESDVDTPFICAVGVAYREQHARDVAVVEQALRDARQEITDARDEARKAIASRLPVEALHECEARQYAASGFLCGVQAVLAALTGEEEK